MLFALGIHANRTEHVVSPKDQAAQIDDEQLQLVEAPAASRYSSWPLSSVNWRLTLDLLSCRT